MPRLFRNRLACDFAAAVLVIFAAVSVGHINDYGAHPQATCSSAGDGGESANGLLDAIESPDVSDPDAEHACCCLLCVTTVSCHAGPGELPCPGGTLSGSAAARVSSSSHGHEVFHPPSA